MKKNASVISIAYFTFLLLCVLSEGLTGISSGVMYYLAFILPFFAVILFTDREIPKIGEFSWKVGKGKLFLPTVFPTVLVISLLSAVTALVISLFGVASPVRDLGDNLIFALLHFALLPSILEELLFRYLPMRYIAPYSKRYAVIFSSIFFSLAHHSFFSIPYAFFAGAVFMMLNLLCDSCLPSIILHFVNNAVSVVWMMYFGEKYSGFVLLAVLAVPSVISLPCLFKLRGSYAEGLSDIFLDKGERGSAAPMIFAALVAVIAAFVEIAV